MDASNVFLLNAFSECIQAQEEEIKDACTNTIGKSLEDDPSGSETLKMVLEFKTVSADLHICTAMICLCVLNLEIMIY